MKHEGTIMSEEELEVAVTSFLQTSFNSGEPEKAVSEYVGETYIQHNPQVGDGAKAFVDFVHSFRGRFPQLHLEIKRVIAQGDMVVTHSNLKLTAAEPGMAVADFFRSEDGKLVEHWDVIQAIPDASANSNGMF
jgi:predicted SnoaL-like aldol condensation-catalyzing enzyme